jgi:DNA-binding LacI/PurR family transcriptional regulator
MVKQRHGALTLLVDNLGTVPDLALWWLLEHAADRGILLHLERIDRSGRELPLAVRERTSDGVIAFQDLSPAIHEAIAHIELPSLWVNCDLPSGPNVLRYNEHDAAQRAGELLCRDQARTLYLQQAPGTNYWHQERWAGIQQAAKRAGCPAPRCAATPEELWAAVDSASEKHPVGIVMTDRKLFAKVPMRAVRAGIPIPSALAVIVLAPEVRHTEDLDPHMASLTIDTNRLAQRILEYFDTCGTTTPVAMEPVRYDDLDAGETTPPAP